MTKQTDRESCNAMMAVVGLPFAYEIIMCVAVVVILGVVVALTAHNLSQGKEVAQVQPDPDRQSELDRAYVRKQSTQLLIDNAKFKVQQREQDHDWVGANLELTDLVKLLDHRGVIDNEIIAAERARYERLVGAINEN